MEIRGLNHSRKYGLPLKEIGKVVVATSSEEVGRLETLYSRGAQNNVEVELLNAGELRRIEPAAKTFEKFLWSPTTAISDPKAVLDCLCENFINSGGKVLFGKQVELKLLGGAVVAMADGGEVKSNFIINAAGVHADRLAKQVGVGLEFVCLPFRGVYRVSKKSNESPKTLVYPVPHPVNPFLGVHVTITLNGDIKIGPTALPVLGREQYSLRSFSSWSGTKNALRSAYSLVRGSEYDLPEILRSELPKVFTSNLVKDVTRLAPGTRTNSHWRKLPPGIRAQLVNLPEGKLEQDFIVRKNSNSIHVLNTVSPGWTSATPFARWIVETMVI